MIRVVALDFDGVVMDTVHDVFITCQQLLEERGEKLEDSAKNSFIKGRNFLRTGKYLYALTELTKKAVDFDKITQEEFDDFVKLHEVESKKFSDDFFAARKKLQDENFDKWLSRNKLYDGIKDAIEKLSKRFHLTVTSTKDFNSIATSLERFGINIKKDKIFSKEVSEDKKELIERVAEQFSVKPDEIFFIDDMPKHVEYVREIGVIVALAGWGYNNEEQREEVRQLGIPIIDMPEDIEKEIKRLNEE